MKTTLVVTQPFAHYERGHEITDADEAAAVLESNPHHVVRRGASEPDKSPVRKTAPKPGGQTA